MNLCYVGSMRLVSNILERTTLRRKGFLRLCRQPIKDVKFVIIACAKYMANESWVGVEINVINMTYMGTHMDTRSILDVESTVIDVAHMGIHTWTQDPHFVFPL